jgi:hypothetical protein
VSHDLGNPERHVCDQSSTFNGSDCCRGSVYVSGRDWEPSAGSRESELPLFRSFAEHTQGVGGSRTALRPPVGGRTPQPRELGRRPVAGSERRKTESERAL